MNEKEDISQTIRPLIWSGHYDQQGVVESVMDVLAEDEFDEDWVRSQVDAEWAMKEAEELTWEVPTDCDRLNDVFNELWARNIIALQAAGYTSSDGHADVTGYWEEAGGARSAIEGYCFFHEQDMERVMNGGGLMLAFGDIHGGEELGLKVGRTVCEVLDYFGFVPNWDETIGSRILLPWFTWRKSGSSYIAHQAALERHCERLRASLKPEIQRSRGGTDQAGSSVAFMGGTKYMIASCMGFMACVFAMFMLDAALFLKGGFDAVRPVYSGLILLVGCFALMCGLRLWGRWWYLVPVCLTPIVFLLILGALSFAPFLGRGIACGAALVLAVVFGWRSTEWVHRRYQTR